MNINKNYKFEGFFEENSRDQRKIDFLIFHHIEANNIENALDLLKKHQVSSHYLIDEDGQIHLLVDENDIAYHAGVSYFNGFEGLNANSIGIELLNHDVNNNSFQKAQLDSLIELSKNLIEKYQIPQKNIAGHSDIGYFSKNCDEKLKNQIGFLNRKDDPSHMFDWKYMAQNGVSIFPDKEFVENDEILFKLDDSSQEILQIKEKLVNFGYKITNFDGNFDIEMQNLSKVFNRRFNPNKYVVNSGVWWKSSEFICNQLK